MKQKCSQCQEMVNDDSLIVFGDDSVCHSCKPRYVQRLKEGVELTEGGANLPLKFSIGFKVAFGFCLVISIVAAVLIWPEAIKWSNPEHREINQLDVFSHPLSIIWMWTIALHPIFMLLALARLRAPVYVAMLLPLYTIPYLIWDTFFTGIYGFSNLVTWGLACAILCLYEATLFARLKQLKKSNRQGNNISRNAKKLVERAD